jgi:hypothetical protein
MKLIFRNKDQSQSLRIRKSAQNRFSFAQHVRGTCLPMLWISNTISQKSEVGGEKTRTTATKMSASTCDLQD